MAQERQEKNLSQPSKETKNSEPAKALGTIEGMSLSRLFRLLPKGSRVLRVYISEKQGLKEIKKEKKG